MFPPPAHDVSTAMAAAKPAIFMTSLPTLPPLDPALHTPTPMQRLFETGYASARVTGVTS
jgi:hypothetical protein